MSLQNIVQYRTDTVHADGSTKWKFIITFYCPNGFSGEALNLFPFLKAEDNLSYFISKAEFNEEVEAALYGQFLSEGLKNYMLSEESDKSVAEEMLRVCAVQKPCPKNLIEGIKEDYKLLIQDIQEYDDMYEETDFEEAEPENKKKGLLN